jgi:hypothetical protein
MFVTKKESKIVPSVILVVLISSIVRLIIDGYADTLTILFLTVSLSFLTIYFTFAIIKSVRQSRQLKLTEKEE